MAMLILIVALLVLDVLALHYGVDSREGFNNNRSPSLR
jgi:hypothetical protein